MTRLELRLDQIRIKDGKLPSLPHYSLAELRRQPWSWDRVVRGTDLANCSTQRACLFNIYVRDGVALGMELAGAYPPRKDPAVPDFNPRGCQKGMSYFHRMYDPTRIKYPLKRIGARGEGQWKRVGWDEALGEIADILIDVLVRDGPESIVLGGGTMGEQGKSTDMAFLTLWNELGCPSTAGFNEIADEREGVALTFGKLSMSGSADNMYYADIILIWGGNPAYTQIPNFHFITEARYNGIKIITISPDYSPSAIHADLWVPVNIGSDAALALSIVHVIINENLYKEEFVREQTDLPLLVREDTGKFLRERDLRKGGRDDVFYVWDLRSSGLAEVPRRSLLLSGLLPALKGKYQVDTLEGSVIVRPVFEVLRHHLTDYAPDKTSRITGVSPQLICQLARDIARATGVVNVDTTNWGKFYHGNLIERAILLIFALCGHLGRKGACYNAQPQVTLDTAFGGQERRGEHVLLGAAAADPRYAEWREAGYTDEMILYEYAREAVARGDVNRGSLFYYVHAGLLNLSTRHNSWDPYLQRPVAEYVQEAFQKGWQAVVPPASKEPKVMFAAGGNFLRRVRGTQELIGTLLPKLRLLVTVDWRMSTTALYSDYVLPACGWLETCILNLNQFILAPYMHLTDQAIEPLYESKDEWDIFCLLSRKIEERARDSGFSSFKDAKGNIRRLDTLYDRVTLHGLYTEGESTAVARDLAINASNIENRQWEELLRDGMAPFTGVGGTRSLGHACDVNPGEPVVPLTWHIEKKQPYPTLTRRIQFYIDHDWYQELGEVLPTHKDPPKAGGAYPLRLTGGHARWSVHSVWVDDAMMLRLQRGTPVMFMNPLDAEQRGITDGDEVEVYNDIASFRIQAAASSAVRPAQVIIYHLWENFQFDGWRHFKGVMPTPMNPVELAGGYFHIRATPSNFYPGHSDRDTRVEARKVE